MNSIRTTSDPLAPFLQDYAAALHASGVPSHRLEAAMQALLAALGREGAVLATPTGLWLDVDGATRMCRVEPASGNLAHMEHLVSLGEAVQAGTCTVAEAHARLQAPVQPTYGPAALWLAAVLSVCLATVVLGGSAWDVMASVPVGIAATAVHSHTARSARWRLVGDLATAAAAAGLAGALVAVGVQHAVVTLAGVIVVVPGLTLTVALAELANRSLTAGTSRMAGAGMTLFLMGSGIAMGWSATHGVPVLWAPPAPWTDPLPAWATWLAVAVAPLCFTVLFQARARYAPRITAASVAAFALATAWPGLAGATAAALLVGLAGNHLTHRSQAPAATVVLPALLLLVPGLMGLRGVGALLEQDVMEGLAAALQAVETASALVVGLLLAHGLLPPPRAV